MATHISCAEGSKRSHAGAALVDEGEAHIRAERADPLQLEARGQRCALLRRRFDAGPPRPALQGGERERACELVGVLLAKQTRGPARLQPRLRPPGHAAEAQQRRRAHGWGCLVGRYRYLPRRLQKIIGRRLGILRRSTLEILALGR